MPEQLAANVINRVANSETLMQYFVNQQMPTATYSIPAQ
jgi:hypothetical protein